MTYVSAYFPNCSPEDASAGLFGVNSSHREAGAGFGDGRHLGQVPLELPELKSCFLLGLTECGHSAVPSMRGRRTQPFRGSALGPTWLTQRLLTWAAQPGGRFRLWGDKPRWSTHTGHRPRGGAMSATGEDAARAGGGIRGECDMDPGIEARAAL